MGNYELLDDLVRIHCIDCLDKEDSRPFCSGCLMRAKVIEVLEKRKPRNKN